MFWYHEFGFFFLFTVISCKIQTLASISNSSFFRGFFQQSWILSGSGSALDSSNPRNSFLTVEIKTHKTKAKHFHFSAVIFPAKEKWKKFLHSPSFKMKTFLNTNISSRTEIRGVSQLWLKVPFWIHSTSEASLWVFPKVLKSCIVFSL